MVVVVVACQAKTGSRSKVAVVVACQAKMGMRVTSRAS